MAKISFASNAPSLGRWCDSCSSQIGLFHSLRDFIGMDHSESCHRYLCAHGETHAHRGAGDERQLREKLRPGNAPVSDTSRRGGGRWR